MHAKIGYKVVFNQNSTMNTLHGYQTPYNTVVNVPEPNTENWIGYFIPETQTPQIAFGSFLDELYSIKTKNWSMDRVKPKRGAAWIISPNMTLSYGEMVVVKKFAAQPGYPEIDNFVWQRIGFQQQSDRQETEYFSYAKELDYTPVYIQLDALSTAKEIAVMVDDECYGAAVVDNDLVMIQAYISTIPDGADIQLVAWDGAKFQAAPLSYNVYDSYSNQFVPRANLVKQDTDFYYVRLGDAVDGDTPDIASANVSIYPNPFNPTTTIRYVVPKDGEVKLSIYNLKGQLIRTLVCEAKKTGTHSIVWNGDDQAGKRISSGIYFTRMETNGKTLTNKMLMLK